MAATSVSAASDQRKSAARPIHLKVERRENFRCGMLAGVSGVGVTFKNKGRGRIAAYGWVLRADPKLAHALRGWRVGRFARAAVDASVMIFGSAAPVGGLRRGARAFRKVGFSAAESK